MGLNIDYEAIANYIIIIGAIIIFVTMATVFIVKMKKIK